MRKKLKGFAVPMLVHEMIYADSQYFSLKKETLCNMVVQVLGLKGLQTLGTIFWIKQKVWVST